MQPPCFEVIYPSTWGAQDAVPGQLPAHYEKLMEDAGRCPCWRCEKRGSCISECRRFRQYCCTGKDR